MSVSAAVVATSARNPRRWIILAAAVTAVFITTNDTGNIELILPAINKELRPDATTVGMISAIAQMVMACSLLGAGSIADIFGRKKVLLAGTALYLALSIHGFLVTGGLALLWNRGLTGIAAAFINPMVAATIMAVFDKDELEKAFSIYVGAIAASGALNSPLEEWVNAGLGWRYTFLMTAGLALLALIVIPPIVPDTKSATKRPLDFPGIILSGAGLLGIVYGFNSAGELGFGAPKAYISLLVGVVFLIALTIYSLRVKYPAIQVRLFTNPLFTCGMVLLLFLYAATDSITFWGAVYGMTVPNLWSPMEAGWMYGLFMASLAVFGFLVGPVSEKIKPHVLILAGMTIASISLPVMASQFKPTGSIVILDLGAVLAGAGWAIANTPRMAVSLSTVPTDHAAAGASINQCFGWLGMTLDVAVTCAVFPLLANSTWTKVAAGKPAITNWFLPPQAPDLVNSWAVTWGQALFTIHLFFAAIVLALGIWGFFAFQKQAYVTSVGMSPDMM